MSWNTWRKHHDNPPNLQERPRIVRGQIFYEVETSIPACFRQVAEAHPTQTALGGGAWQPTYAELDAATTSLADVLIARGAKTGDRVALLMRHDAPLIAAALAVLKTGGIVVVLNPTEPPARLKHILDDAEPNLIVTDAANENLAGHIAGKNREIIFFDGQTSVPAKAAKIKITPTDVAWLIYTSGSTGNPKGVMQTHRNILHNVLRLSRGTELSAEDRVVLLGSPSGGLGVATMWCALLNGAALFPFPIMEKGVAGFKNLMLENKITVYVSSVSVFRSFVKTLADTDFFPHVKLVRFASETATADDFAAFKKHFPGNCILLHTLSSSETGNITQHRLTHNDKFGEGRLPVGRPADGIEILLLDENGREVRAGEIGEVVVKSRHLSPGYWRNETLTAECFSENGGTGGARSFRSGDLGRRAADGALIFMGRKDARVKVHGYRIELSEVEETLARQPEVERAVVSASAMPDGRIQLVAHVVPRAGRNCTAEILRRGLGKTLPGYMTPAHFFFLEKIPLTPHGKVDREKLLQFNPPAAATTAENPATETEVLLAGIWKKVFNRESIGRRDNFFDLGGDSLNAAVLAAEIHTAFEVELNLRAFAEHSTLEKLSLAVDNLCRERGAKGLPRLARAPRDVPLPLSFAQERCWKHSQTPEGSLGYTMALSYHICGPLNADILRESMSYLVRRHEILRTTFDEVGGQLSQIVHPAEPMPLPVLDFVGAPDAEERATLVLRQEGRRLFNFKQLPLLRFILVRIRENEYWLLRLSHHIISDAWSWKIYFRELGQIYEAKSRGETPPLPEFEPLQYGDYAAQQRRDLNPDGAAYREIVAWWDQQFSGRSRPVKLPFQRFWRSRRAQPADGHIWWGFNSIISRRLDQIAREEGTTYYTIRLAAFVALLSAKASQSDVVLGTYVTERSRVETQNMFGYFVNLATLNLQCDHARTFREWLSTVRKLVGEVQARAEIPCDQLYEELRRQGANPSEIGIIFSIGAHTAPVRFGGLELTWLDRRMEAMPWGFCVTLDQHDEEHRCRAAFDARIYNPARVRKWIKRFVRLVEAIAANPDRSVGELLSAASRK
ncbi:MAG TPA: condensation domain-containing protein [Candidatus Aquilonibacter sp.]|nr:condensation domain-containing protein [Candidatus Aquilonibacter sp.]